MAVLWILFCFALLGVSSGHGEPASLPELSIMPRVINGKNARPGAWPWNVALLNPNGTLICGGSLLSNKWVITAAHCNVTRSDKAVVGLYDTRSAGDIQKLRIAQIFRHPKFNHTTWHSDIALLKLRRRAHYNNKVSPVLLPQADDKFLPWASCKIMGWGYTDVNETKIPDKLQVASMPVVHNDLCKMFFHYFSPDVMLCAGLRGISSTPGDAGGSLVCWKSKTWTLAGIVSFNRVLNPTSVPFVATRVSPFVPWIEEVLAHY